MREIKMRVRDNATKELLGYEVFNSTLNDGFYYVDYAEPEGERICYTNYSERPMLKPKNPCDQLLREQFTSLTDCNGSPIYEGDIISLQWVREDPYIGVVKHADGAFYMDDPDGFIVSHLRQAYADKCTVIGNIHQNPDLIDRE